MKLTNIALLIICFAGSILASKAQESPYRPGLAFREDWKEIPAAIPVSQDHVAHPDLLLDLYGPGQDSIKKSHHDQPADDPYYIWSGLCLDTWAVTLRHKDHLLDLRSYSRIRWRSKQAGFRHLHIVLKLADGTWLVSRQADGPSGDWRIREFIVSDLTWHSLHIESMTEGKVIEAPDLGRVDEIGFTDLMKGGKSQACSRLDWLEVYAYLVSRY